MTILRALTIVIWAIVAAYMTPAVWSLIHGRPRRADPSRLAWFCVALAIVVGTARWIIDPQNDELWLAIQALFVASGFYTLWASISYGRGPRV